LFETWNESSKTYGILHITYGKENFVKSPNFQTIQKEFHRLEVRLKNSFDRETNVDIFILCLKFCANISSIKQNPIALVGDQ